MKPTVGELCARYLSDYPKIGGTQRNVLERLQREGIAKVRAPGTSKDFVDHCRKRRQTVAPCTVLLDVIGLRGVLAYAKPGWGLSDVTDTPLREAFVLLKKQGLIDRARHRTQVPTPEQTAEIVAYFRERAARYQMPMDDIAEFQFESTRRISETCRVLWPDLDTKTKTILVRDMKHPRHKEGNHQRVALPDKAFEIIMRQPRRSNDPDERIFPFNPRSVQAAYRRAVKWLGYDNLHLHDSRRGGTTKLLKEGRSVPEVMLVTGHIDPRMVLTTYNGLKAEDFHTRRAA